MKKHVRTMLSIQATPDIAGIRTSELMGQEHTVIPCVALVEGVLWPSNAPGPELALAEEFGRFPDGWNGRPVMYNHPTLNGEPVTANSPDILKDNAFGQLFNTIIEGGKLKTEIWINEARITEMDEEAQIVIQNLKDGEGMVEVSTGLFTMQEPLEGSFKGKDYVSIWRNIVPDHLAILPEGITGACSIADGAGAPRTNQQGVMRALQLNTSDIEENPPNEQSGLFKRLLEIAGGALGFTSSSKYLSDSDLRAALNAGLSAESDRYFFILAVYPEADDSGIFVYELGWEGELFQVDFSIMNGQITIGKEKTPVRPVTTFVPVEITANSKRKENAMSKEALVKDLIANEALQYTEDDSEWLNTLEESQLERMTPLEVKSVVNNDLASAADPDPAQLTANAQPKAVTTKEYIDAAPEELRQVLNSGLEMHRKRKGLLVKALMDNSRCTFTQKALEAKDITELENIAALATDISYEGQSVTLSTNTGEEADEVYTPATPIFDLKPKKVDAA